MTPEKMKLLFEAIASLKRGNYDSPDGKCMHEGCNEGPIKAHTLSRFWLKSIAYEGKVERVKAGVQMCDDGKPAYKAEFEAVNIASASTFAGFCKTHDNDLFLNIDRLDVKPTADDCMKLIYRAVCREAASKTHIVKTFRSIDMDKDPVANATTVLPEERYGERLYAYKSMVAGLIASGDYSDFEHLVFDLPKPPPYLGTSTFMPLTTTRGRVLGLNPEFMTFSILPSGSGGIVILSWRKIDNKWGAMFAQSLRRQPAALIGMALSRVLFEISENIYFSPDFLGDLDVPRKEWLLNTKIRSIVNGEIIPPGDVLCPNYQTDQPFALEVSGFRTL